MRRAWLALLLCGSQTVLGDYYRTLGVGRRASKQEIKAAYRKLALANHPDKVEPHERDAAAERFKSITEAYETLSDPQKKRMYNQFGSSMGGGGGGGGGFGGFDPSAFGGAFAGGMPGFAPRPVVPPPRARRAFYCTLSELDAGCARKIVLHDGPASRLRDALHDGFRGPSGKALWNTLTLGASLAWRMPNLLFGRAGERWIPLWLRLPALVASLLAAMCQQLPPSPDGTFEFEVTPGWRQGTRVVFKGSAVGASRDPALPAVRAVAFELRERRHPTLHRSKHDLVQRVSVARSVAEAGTTLALTDLGGTEHAVELELSAEEVTADVVHRTIEGLGLPRSKPKKGTPKRGDLRLEITLRGATPIHAAPAARPTPQRVT